MGATTPVDQSQIASDCQMDAKHNMTTRFTMVLIVVSLWALLGGSAVARTLCGQTYDNLAGLQGSLRDRPGVQIYNNDKRVTVIFDSTHGDAPGTYWWFSKPPNPAYPAVVCSYFNNRRMRVTANDCAGAPSKACNTLANRLAKAKF
jgi:hypothetical protein